METVGEVGLRLRLAAARTAAGTRQLRRVHKAHITSTQCSLRGSCALRGMGLQGGERGRGGGELWRVVIEPGGGNQ
jgi:hypothetical protein